MIKICIFYLKYIKKSSRPPPKVKHTIKAKSFLHLTNNSLSNKSRKFEKKKKSIRGNHEILRTGASIIRYLKVTKNPILGETLKYGEEATKSVVTNRKYKKF